MEMTVIDTGGLEDAERHDRLCACCYSSLDMHHDVFSLRKQMMDQTLRALENATVALFLIDARDGVLHDDEHFARYYITSLGSYSHLKTSSG